MTGFRKPFLFRAALGALALAWALTGRGAENRVLQLGGTNGFLQIAGKSFADLEEATIEGWVRWNTDISWARFFDLGLAGNSLNLGRLMSTPHLNIESSALGRLQVVAPFAYRTNEWMHLAAVIGAEEFTLYFNGTQVAVAANTLPFNALTGQDRMFIGRNNWFDSGIGDLPDSAIDVDEFRVWKGARTREQIKDGMFRRAEPGEEGLALLLNFEGGAAKDEGPRRLSVTMEGNAKIVAMPLPDNGAGFPKISILSGKVLDKEGNGVAGAVVSAVVGENSSMIARTDAKGEFEYGSLLETEATFEIAAVKNELAGRSKPLTISPGTVIEETILLHPPQTISGSVVAHDRSPLAGIVVELLRGEAAGTNAVVARTRTDQRGNYSFELLAAGTYQAQAIGRAGPVLHRNGAMLELKEGVKLTGIDFAIAPLRRGNWQTYNAAMGLPSDAEVRRILFERTGAVWFATMGGAARYDGVEWQVFTASEGLPDDFVLNMAQDTKGHIWFATATGVARFDGKRVRAWGRNEGIVATQIDGILADDDGSVWFAGDGSGGPFLLRIKDEKLKQIRPADGLPGRVFKMAKGKGKDIWMCGPIGGLARYDGSAFEMFTHPEIMRATDTPSIGPDGSVWFATQTGVARFDGKNIKPIQLSEQMGGFPLVSTFWTRDGTLWAASRGGLLRSDGTNFVAQIGEDGMPVRGIISVSEGPDGTMWFGTFGRGALRYEKEPAFESFTMAHGLMAKENLFSRRASDGTLWFHPTPAQRSEDGEVWNGSEFVPMEGITGYKGWKGASVESKSGLILPTRAGLFVRRGNETKRFAPEGGLAGIAYAAVEAADGSIWAAGNNGVSRRKDGKWTHHMLSNGFPLSWAITLLADKAGRVWTGNFGGEGLAVFENEKWTHYTTTNGLSGNGINALMEDSDGSIWIATDGGLSHWKEGRFNNYVKGKNKDTLPQRSARAVYRDSRGILWVGTVGGATRFDGKVWSTLRSGDGLGSDAVRTIVEGPDGAMWLGTDEGITRYMPNPGMAATPNVTVVLDKAYDAAERLPTILKGRRVRFQAEVGDIKTRTDARRFIWGVFSGNILGDDSGNWPGWMPASASSSMEWTAPATGNYTVAVRYVDRDLNYSKPVMASFEVVPPWYMNAFIAGPVGVGSVGLLGWAFVARMLYMQKRREAERLRAEMLQQEKQARAALELKNRELEKAMEAAESANRTKSQFLATMSHELRTPLNAILGYSEMLEEELEDRKDVIPDLKKIHSAGKHLLGLINDVLDLSKIEAGKMTIFPENFDIATTVQEIARTVEPLVTKNGNRLVVTIAPELGSMFSDLTKVRQTLFNLLSNAAKFTENGTVSIAVSDLPGSSLIQFTIADSGIGMTEEQIGKLFQAFSQADASTSRKYGGTGLGLALSRNFCRLLGGDIEVRSEQGKGSVFTVRLPRRISAAGMSEVVAAGVGAAAPTKDRPHVLVIDDDPAVRELMNRHLMKEGYAVSLAASGEQGLELARARKPDIITVDIIMPGQDGWSVLNSLKADKGLQNIPVVLVSMLDEKPLGFSLGAADYIVKPIDWERLSGTLQKLRAELPSNEVLIVEDDAAMRDMLTRQLEKQTWSVRAAENGRVALEVLKTHTPGIVLLDLMMPEMDGFAFLEEFRRNKDWQHIPVIVVTAKDLSREDLAQLEGRIRKVVQKSAQTMDEVVAEIRAASVSTATRA